MTAFWHTRRRLDEGPARWLAHAVRADLPDPAPVPVGGLKALGPREAREAAGLPQQQVAEPSTGPRRRSSGSRTGRSASPAPWRWHPATTSIPTSSKNSSSWPRRPAVGPRGTRPTRGHDTDTGDVHRLRDRPRSRATANVTSCLACCRPRKTPTDRHRLGVGPHRRPVLVFVGDPWGWFGSLWETITTDLTLS